MDTVIVVETGDYEDRCVWMVAESRESAITALKKEHESPYVVTWRETEYGLEGTFELVPHYSTEHVARFDFLEYNVV